MALTEIEYGSLASSEVMNNNFEYLDNKISTVVDNIASQMAGVNSNIASVGATLNNTKDELEATIDETADDLKSEMKSLISENGLYVVTYVNGTSWYREYFSDSAKTSRVWLEQGGRAEGIGKDASTIVNFLKNFTNTNYYVSFANAYGLNIASRGMSAVTDFTTSSFVAINGNDVTISAIWYACGK